MANKRMFALQIIDSDVFLDMPQSTQLLYFHLGMRADDDGFINNAKTIMRMVGCKEDDLRLLIAKKFIMTFESGIVVIKHWNINNYIQKDRYHETKYLEEKSQLNVDNKGSYTFNEGVPALEYRTSKKEENKQCIQPCIQNVHKMETEIRLDKIRLDKVSIDKNSISIEEDKNILNKEKEERKKEREYTHAYSNSNSIIKNNIKILKSVKDFNDLDIDTRNSIFDVLNATKDTDNTETKELRNQLETLANNLLWK